MKALSCKSVLLTISLFIGIVFAKAQSDDRYIYDIKYSNEKMCSKTIFTRDESSSTLRAVSRYEFKYDNRGRLIEKIAYHMNSNSTEWEKHSRMEFTYQDGEETVTVNLALWDPQRKCFSVNQKQQILPLSHVTEHIAES